MTNTYLASDGAHTIRDTMMISIRQHKYNKPIIEIDTNKKLCESAVSIYQAEDKINQNSDNGASMDQILDMITPSAESVT